jgi:nucleoside-diphosphate-sugar epimerase
MSLLQLINEINTLLGTSIAPIFGIPHEEDLTSSQADIAGARRLLHYEPLVSFERGLAESASWLVGSMSARPEAKEHLIAI